MEISKIEKFERGLHATFMVTFKEDVFEVVKAIRMGVPFVAKKLNAKRRKAFKNSRDLEVIEQVIRKSREAVRDIAYIKHGGSWRDHVSWGIFWAGELTVEEKRLAKVAEEMLGKII